MVSNKNSPPTKFSRSQINVYTLTTLDTRHTFVAGDVMLTLVDGRLLNSREVGNAVAQLLLTGTPIDQICEIDGMPTPTQIAYLRKNDSQFAEALQIAFEGAGIESAFILINGARTGRIGKNQVDAAKWVAERMAPDLFQERKTVTTNELHTATDDELMFQLQAAMRSDERVKRIFADNAEILAEIVPPAVTDREVSDRARKTLKQLKRFMVKRKH